MTSGHLDIAGRRTFNSGLDGAGFNTAAEVVAWHGAMQAQDYGPAKWSIAQRAAHLGEQDIDTAVADGSIVRTHVLRPTWHFVAREDARWLLALTGPRVQQAVRSRYRQLGLDDETLARSRKQIAAALEESGQLTRDQLAEHLERGRLDVSGQRLPHLLMDAELEAVICSGPRQGRHHTYGLFDERVPDGPPRDREKSVVELTRRYLGSHGPASLNDLGWWSSLTIADLKTALSALGPEVARHRIDEVELWSLSSAIPPASGKRGLVHLLQSYDEMIVGYTKTRYLGDPRADAARAAWKNRNLPTGVVLLGGRVAGHWRRVTSKQTVSVEVLVYEELDRGGRAAVEKEASKLAEFLGRSLELQVRLLPRP